MDLNISIRLYFLIEIKYILKKKDKNLNNEFLTILLSDKAFNIYS